MVFKEVFILVLFSFCAQFMIAQEGFNVIPINEQVYVHQTSYAIPGQGNVLVNGLLINTSDGVILVNTPPSKNETSKLLQWIDAVIQKPVIMFVATDFSPMSIAGVEQIKELGSVMVSTQELLNNTNTLIPEGVTFVPFTEGYYTIGEVSFELKQLSSNNLSFWLSEEKTFYASNYIVGEGVNKMQLKALKRIIEEKRLMNLQSTYSDALFVIPGLGEWNDLSSVVNYSLLFIK